MNRTIVVLASLLIVTTPLAGCLDEVTLEELIDDIVGCMDNEAQNYDENATTELVGNCIYAASMAQFMEALDEEMSIDEMLNQIPRAGYSNIISTTQFSEDLNQMLDITMEEHVMVDLENNSAMVRIVLSVDSMISTDYQVIQVGEVVNIHSISSGIIIEEPESVSVQTRDSDGSVMDMVHSVLSGSPMSDDSDDDDDDSDLPENMSASFTYDSTDDSQTMHLTLAENDSSISLSVTLDENKELMSYQMYIDDGTNQTTTMYTVMWGDAVVIDVDTTLPKTSIPIWLVAEEYEPEMACGNHYGDYFSDDVNEDSCNSWIYLEDYDSPQSDEPFTGCYNSYTHVQLEGMSEIECDSYEWTELYYDEPDDDHHDEGNHISWNSYYGGYCEWEGNPDDVGEERWSCKEDASLSDWDNWWYYCEYYDSDHDDDAWHCTDDFGQSEDFEHSADGDEWSDPNDGEDDDDNDNLASIESGTVADNMTYTAPISDFELRFLDCGDEDIDDLNDCTVMASGPLASGTANSSDGFLQMTFTYDDVDTDGMISAGDTLSLNDTMGLHVGIYDLWASEYTNDSKAVGPSLPGFGSLLATISLLGAAFLLPRRDD